ncbi:maleylpyruvate isomerase family mycothiol-dependent enzyme [Saccharopolyspora sp. WRP15-2]|uniref:Maleylpyruvate isomerase family mycothiol-dependent enzyme n=1 Tax=Saccharopolyspora oryzae TaxID=2997343 RepID=A0ABT4UXJ3_9PSEU|nr:maleylpyruvate isomerase family mycothiol-dependent enzyme [Saccharopolyspora oryzae]MDA3626430.1 maleylpyruvate isomerase family mycothiol-dependent enzyme [Saccharopolyspora oryzae]
MLDVRRLFVRERAELLALLRSLSAEDWARETVCPGWDVHDVVGHVLNDYVRRISGSRDGFAGATFANDETLPSYLARTNDEFVRAARQCSPELMIELLGHLGPELDRLWAGFDLTAPAPLDVSWAGPGRSPAWLDIAREYTEFWVHQQQIRDAVGRPGADQPELVHPVLDTFLRGLPHALREVERPHGTAVRVVVTGPSGGTWHAVSDEGRWRMAGDETELSAGATVTMRPDDLWRLGTRGITVAEARRRADAEGDPALVEAVTALLAVVA